MIEGLSSDNQTWAKSQDESIQLVLSYRLGLVYMPALQLVTEEQRFDELAGCLVRNSYLLSFLCSTNYSAFHNEIERKITIGSVVMDSPIARRFGGLASEHDETANSLIRDDRLTIENGANVQDLLVEKLWKTVSISENWIDRYDAFLNGLLSGKSWSFWRNWYEKAVHGINQDQALNLAVAHLPDNIWFKSIENLAPHIEHIEKKLELQEKIRTLEYEIKSRQSFTIHRSHNNPPELVDESYAITTLLDNALLELRKASVELKKEQYSKSTLEEVRDRIKSIAVKLAHYVGKLADTAAVKSAEEVGSTGTKWAIRVGSAYAISHIEPLRKGLEEFVDLLQQLLTLIM